jgi:hypothetical protein
MIIIEPDPSRHSRRNLQLRGTNRIAAPLRPSMTDVVQGNLAGCPVVATLAALAHTRPTQLASMLGAPVSGDVFSGRRDPNALLAPWTDHYYDVTFPGNTATIRISGAVYHHSGGVEYASTPAGAGWPSLLEKAYATWRGRGSYERLDLRSLHTVPGPDKVMCDLVGAYDMADIAGSHWYEDVSCRNRKAEKDRALDRRRDMIALAGRANRRPTVAASRQTTRHGTVDNHAYAVLGYRGGRIRLRNPHGGSGATVGLTVNEFLADFAAVYQAR